VARVFTDGSAAKLITGVNRLMVDATFSAAFWLFRTATPAADRTIITAGDVTQPAGWIVRLLTTNLVQVAVPFSVADKVRSSATAPTLNTWMHVLVTHNQTGTASTDILFYFNGLQEAGTNIAAASGTHDTATACALEIGASTADATSAAPMNIGSVAVWNRAISPAEALALATGTHPLRFKEGLVDYFDLDGSAGEESYLTKLYAAQGATNPTNAAVRPPIEAIPLLWESRLNTAPRSRARARYSANAAAGGPVINDHNFRRIIRGAGMGVMRGTA
jgi:hypothetical protein